MSPFRDSRNECGRLLEENYAGLYGEEMTWVKTIKAA